MRRLYRGDAARSRKARGSAELAALEAKGAAIVVIELQGALFFGSAEHLSQVIETQLAANGKIETRCVILDLRRITEIDFDRRPHRLRYRCRPHPRRLQAGDRLRRRRNRRGAGRRAEPVFSGRRSRHRMGGR